MEAAARARYPAARDALGLTLDSLDDFQGWVSSLEADFPAALPFARLSVCWQTADLWREEAGTDALSAAVFAIQDALYQPNSKSRRELRRELSALQGYQGGQIRARRAQAMHRLVRGTGAFVLDGKSSRDDLALGFVWPDQWSFSSFVRVGLWVFETEALTALLAGAIGERILHEDGDWLPLESPPG